MRRFLALFAGKCVTLLGKLTRRQTSSAPGQIALKICPHLIRDIKSHINKKIIVTCGTNGKTTTNNLLATALEEKGYSVLCNKIGANMLSGIVTSYIDRANIFGKFKADYACFEIDEAYARIVFDHFKPDMLIMTNLFRDQLDRYGEVDTTSLLLKEAIGKCPDIKLILNGDDPLCVQFAKEQNSGTIFYGVSSKVLTQEDEHKEGKYCPICQSPLVYDFYHYSQLGKFKCSNCDFSHPTLNIDAQNVSLQSPMSFSVNEQKITTNQKGFYNIYNLLAVYSALTAIGESTQNFEGLFEKYQPQVGRMQEFNLGKKVILSLSKNPAGFNQAIATVNTDIRLKDVIISINDNPGDGLDVSWLWDVNFDRLKNENLLSLSTSGIRMWDMALRFKYADIIPDLTTADIKFAIERALSSNSEVIYILANYTAVYPAEKTIREIMKEKNYEN